MQGERVVCAVCGGTKSETSRGGVMHECGACDGWGVVPPPGQRASTIRPGMKILVIGHAEHGKDAAALCLGRELGVAFISSSEFCAARAVYPLVSDLYADWRACFEDRRNHRALWRHASEAYNLRPGPSLAEQVLALAPIYVGMRSRAEFNRSKSLFDVVVWVDASERLPLEPAASMDLTKDDADLIVDNNRGLSELTDTIWALVNT